MAWRVAKSLLTLRDQIDAKWPNRAKSHDGSIGDARHQATRSEHNQDSNGVVRAIDISNDPFVGAVSNNIAHALANSRDARIKYIISNGQICSSEVSPWQWRPYHKDPHDRHFHISVVDDPALYDSTRPWEFTEAAVQVPVTKKRYKNIVATVFGGEADQQTTAYGPWKWSKPGVALPYRFPADKRPNVRVYFKGKSVVCPVMDVGPWNIHDPYWELDRRPQAESGTDQRGRRTNRAGIDLTPGAAKILDFPGLGTVDWEFDTPPPNVITQDTRKPIPKAPMVTGGILAALLAAVGTHWQVALLVGATLAVVGTIIYWKNRD